MVGWFKEGISKERLDIIFNPSHFIVFNYILDGMMLKRNKFVIQWRKFEIKRSCIFRVMNFKSLYPLLDFYLIFLIYFVIEKNPKKWGFIRRTAGLTWRAGMADAARETRADVTRHTRPRERTWGAAGAQGADTW